MTTEAAAPDEPLGTDALLAEEAAPEMAAPAPTVVEQAAPDAAAPEDAAIEGPPAEDVVVADAVVEDEPARELFRAAEAPVDVAALPAELVVLLNGAAYDSDHGTRIDACTIELDVAGLGAAPEATVPVTVQIWAIPPTVAEGQRALLVDDQVDATADTLELDYPMTDHLAVYEMKTNGYRLAIEVTVGGESLGERQLWLGCGAAQTGHPNRILIEKVWLDEAGQPVTGLDAVLPEGWREDFAIEATSSRGTAVCTYPEGSDVLVCEYDNPGHGSKPGLVVPNGKKHTYEVVELGLPEGWEVDPATVGTFVGRETCDRGGGCGDGGTGGYDDGGTGGHDDGGCGGHEAVLAPAAHDEGGHDEGEGSGGEGSGGSTCTHTLANRQLPVPPPPPPEPPAPPAEPAPTEPGPAVLDTDVEADQQARATLPATGTDAMALALAGLSLVVLGAAAEALGRRRSDRTGRLT